MARVLDSVPTDSELNAVLFCFERAVGGNDATVGDGGSIFGGISW